MATQFGQRDLLRFVHHTIGRDSYIHPIADTDKRLDHGRRLPVVGHCFDKDGSDLNAV
ncbi:MAG TPA: hypothetical protein VFC54_03325 [Pseudolabrys sp.]|nr:hypothetical protein [Pseudolabrys sp.]